MSPLQLLLNRHKGKKDPFKLWVYVDSGGNMGAIGGAITTALFQRGLLQLADGYVGSSVGAYVLAYTLTGKGAEGTSIFPRFYCDSRFISLRRAFSRTPIMDLSFVNQTVMKKLEPLSCTAVAHVGKPFYALSWRRGGGSFLQPLSGIRPGKVEEGLTSGARMPIVGSGWNTRRFDTFDGWLAEPDLPRLLEAEGVTHVLHVSNRPSQVPPRSTHWGWQVIAAWLKVTDKQLAEATRTREEGHGYPWHQHGILVERLELSRHKAQAATRTPAVLWKAMEQSYRHTWKACGGSENSCRVPALWANYQTENPGLAGVGT